MSKKRRDIALTGEIFVQRELITTDTQRSFGLNFSVVSLALTGKTPTKAADDVMFLYDIRLSRQGESVIQEVDGLQDRSKENDKKIKFKKITNEE